MRIWVEKTLLWIAEGGLSCEECSSAPGKVEVAEGGEARDSGYGVLELDRENMLVLIPRVIPEPWKQKILKYSTRR